MSPATKEPVLPLRLARHPAAWFVILLLVAIVLRFDTFGDPNLHGDEVFYQTVGAPTGVAGSTARTVRAIRFGSLNTILSRPARSVSVALVRPDGRLVSRNELRGSDVAVSHLEERCLPEGLYLLHVSWRGGREIHKFLVRRGP